MRCVSVLAAVSLFSLSFAVAQEEPETGDVTADEQLSELDILSQALGDPFVRRVPVYLPPGY